MNEPPVPSMFKQLLKHAGVVVNKDPLVTTKPSHTNLPSWENLIKNLVTTE